MVTNGKIIVTKKVFETPSTRAEEAVVDESELVKIIVAHKNKAIQSKRIATVMDNNTGFHSIMEERSKVSPKLELSPDRVGEVEICMRSTFVSVPFLEECFPLFPSSKSLCCA